MADNQVIQTIMEQLKELREQGNSHNKLLADLAAEVRTLGKHIGGSTHEQRIGALEEDFKQIKAYLKVGGLVLGVVWPVVYPLVTEFFRSKFK